MDSQDMGHLMHVPGILLNDDNVIKAKEAMYMGSWKSRGGIGAFFVTARKWDALENMLGKHTILYDVFDACIKGGDGDGSPLEQIRDLRRYLALIEAEVIRLKAPKPPIPVTDESTLKEQGAYGTGEHVNTEHLNDRSDSGPKTV